MTPRLLLAAVALVLAATTTGGAATEPCRMHASHTGAHARSSCGMVRLGAVEVSPTAGLGQVEVRGTMAAVVQRDDGQVALVDLRDPAAPRVLGRYDGGTGRAELDDPLDGDVAFTSDGRHLLYARQTRQYSNDGLHILDISDPTAPRRTAFVPGGGTLRVATFKAADGTEYAYTLDASGGLMTFRLVSTPAGLQAVPVGADALPATKVGGPRRVGCTSIRVTRASACRCCTRPTAPRA